MISASDSFQVDINKESIYFVNVTDPGDALNVSIINNSGILPEIKSMKGSQDGEYMFSIFLTEVTAFTFSVVATDSLGASSTTQPQVLPWQLFLKYNIFYHYVIKDDMFAVYVSEDFKNF